LFNRTPVNTKTEPTDIYHHARLQQANSVSSNACHPTALT
jgi:hypothetical protein